MGTFFEKITGAYSGAKDEEKEEPIREENRVTKTPTVAAAVNQNTSPRVSARDLTRVKTETTLTTDSPEEEEGELTVDIYDSGDSIVIQSTVAGVKPDDLDVSLTSDSITIRGKRHKPEEIDEDNYYYKELFWGPFSRSVILPEEIEENEAEAATKHGLLVIRLPKKKRGVTQKLKVKTI